MSIDPYEFAVGFEEANELADRIIDQLPKMALPGARSGMAVAAMVVVIRRYIASLPPEDQAKMRSAVTYLINREKWTKADDTTGKNA